MPDRHHWNGELLFDRGDSLLANSNVIKQIHFGWKPHSPLMPKFDAFKSVPRRRTPVMGWVGPPFKIADRVTVLAQTANAIAAPVRKVAEYGLTKMLDKAAYWRERLGVIRGPGMSLGGKFPSRTPKLRKFR